MFRRIYYFYKKNIVLFHGNAIVERSFSFNKEFLVENLSNESLVPQRSVHDYIKSVGKITVIKINRSMISEFKSSSSKRLDALNNKKESEDTLKKRKREVQKYQ